MGIDQARLDREHIRIATEILDNAKGKQGIMAFTVSRRGEDTTSVEARGGMSRRDMVMVAGAFLQTIGVRFKEEGDAPEEIVNFFEHASEIVCMIAGSSEAAVERAEFLDFPEAKEVN